MGPLIFASAGYYPACRDIADGIAAALNDDYPNAVSVASLAEIQEYASRGPVVVVPVLMRNLDLLARSGQVSKHNVAIVGWTRRLGMAHFDQFDVGSFLQERGVAISHDFRVKFGWSHLPNRNDDSGQRRLSVSVLEGVTLKCLPVVEVPNDAVDQQTMYFPGRPYLLAQMDTTTELMATEIGTALHKQFCSGYSRTELTLEPSGRLKVSAFVPCPLLSRGSLMAWASKLAGLSFEDLCWELVTNAAGRRFGVVDVHSEAPYPGDALSNFYASRFQYDGMECGSVEGLLQALKYPDVAQQVEIARLAGSAAKHAGAAQNEEWINSQLLWWRGEPMERHSERYQTFLQSIYECLFAQAASFRSALAATRGRVITHRMGKRDASQTVLTEREFVRNLVRLQFRTLSSSST
jgi:hypothetical protein